MKQELTPWFDDHTRPYRSGDYDSYCLFEDRQKRRYWNGAFWCDSMESEPCSLQNFYWRGLAKKP
jgi:hypothetical protein